MKCKLFAGILALLLLAAGTIVYYLYGYKDSLWIQGTAYVLIIFGWLCIFLMIVLLHPPKPLKEQTGKVAWQWMKHRLYFISYLIWLMALVASFALIEIMKDNRVNTVLTRPDVIHTTATVLRIEQRYLRHATHLYAVIAYATATEKIEQAIEDDEGFYKQGQQIQLLYAPQYPDMFKVATPTYAVP